MLRQQRRTEFPVAKMRCDQQDTAARLLRSEKMVPPAQVGKDIVHRQPGFESPDVHELARELLKEPGRQLLGGGARAERRRQVFNDNFPAARTTARVG